MAEWWNLGLEVDGDDAPALSDLLEALGAVAVCLQAADQHIIALSGDEPAGERHWPRTRVTALVPGDTDPQQLFDALREQAPQWAGHPATRERFADQDWIAAFRQRFEPLRFGRLGVRASWSPPFAEDVLDIVIDPGMAFGTGAHATTSLCLAALAAMPDVAGARVIDYGCGSGILAIAAARLGAAEVLAVDIDPLACEIAAANAAANGVAERIRFGLPTLAEGAQADIVVANILLAPLLALAGQLAGLPVPGGRLIMSGITADQVDMLAGRYRGLLVDVATDLQAGWAMLAGRRPLEAAC